jgi:poly-gamma-glutamate capsule biosynthesis protein CapA/YwtB (metallophosphatase superfamily)
MKYMRINFFLLVAGYLLACSPTQDAGKQMPASSVYDPVISDTVASAVVEAAEPERAMPDTLTIAMTGDIMMGTTFPSVMLPANDGKNLFRDVKDLLVNADLAVGNLEGALCDGGQSTKKVSNVSYAFRMPTRFAPLLKEAGFDFLSMANNHANDFGTEGIESTERCLKEQDIRFSGIAGRVRSAVVERNGVRYGLCAFGHNGYTMKHNDLSLVKDVIDELRQQSDIVVVSFHGGAEGQSYSHLPQGREIFLNEDRGSLREFAHFCIDNGADVVYGHGPHVVRCVEVYQGRFIAYSLGNFCTPYGISLKGISGYAPVVTIQIGNDGRFLNGKIHSFIQQRGIGPRKDETNAVPRQMKMLSDADVPQSMARIDNKGNIILK